MRIYKIFLFVLCYLFIIACSMTSSHANKNLYKKDVQYFYGVGYGDTLTLAKENALKDLATNLQVSVQFKTQNTVYQSNQSLETIGNTSLSLESSLKDLSGIEVDAVKKTNKEYEVHVKIKIK